MPSSPPAAAPCSCPIAGTCERHKIFKTEHTHRLCQSSPKMRRIWDLRAGTMPPDAIKHATPPPAEGVGTELKKILAWWGYKPDSKCRCEARAAEMNRNGVEWCEQPENFETIVGWLREGAAELGAIFIEPAARVALRTAIVRAKARESKIEPTKPHAGTSALPQTPPTFAPAEK